jgi:hypothetical protein
LNGNCRWQFVRMGLLIGGDADASFSPALRVVPVGALTCVGGGCRLPGASPRPVPSTGAQPEFGQQREPRRRGNGQVFPGRLGAHQPEGTREERDRV